jgi:ABC-type polysaccharide/polyol phosphate transport system ATPase subunit
MADWMIQCEQVSKRYRLGSIGSGTLSGDLSSFFQKLGPRNRRYLPDQRGNSFWSLKDVSFSVNRGDVFGIIGNNGAGKSTLLKILSQITRPTSGRVLLNGRVASLLEVGTGFHPDLSGRENIFLNGSILGMSRSEIRNKFDEIVSFAGVETFLDTPVKRYSSGMYVRLGFAVAAHLEPEILVVDEVLAVGDHAFQQKCLGKMQDISSEGKTVLFVSHSLSSVKRLCNRGLLLDHGVPVAVGGMNEVLDTYQGQIQEHEAGIRRIIPERSQGFFTSWRLMGDGLPGMHSIYSRSYIRFLVAFTAREQLRNVEVRMLVRYQQLVIAHATSRASNSSISLEPGQYCFEFSFDFPIRDAQFDVVFILSSFGRVIDQWESATRLTVLDRFDAYVDAGMLHPDVRFEVHEGGDFEMQQGTKVRTENVESYAG